MNDQACSLIIDSDAGYVNDLSECLTGSGYKSYCAATLEEGIRIITEKKLLVVLLGLNQEYEATLDNLKSLKIYLPFLEVIILAQKGNFKMASKAMMLGAYDFLVKAPDKKELVSVINRAYNQARKNYKKKLVPGGDKWPAVKPVAPQFIGQSTAIRQTLYLVDKVAPANSSVLISGETGVGKELIARLVHSNSTRHKMPFVPINCGAIPEALLENELFGHIKGAFTDSIGMKRGLLEEANGGTLFLDEVTELSAVLQVKLLRVIETGTFRRLGDNQERWTDIRIVAATNRNINEEIKSGRFRNDLFYRLAVFPIYLQPLRMRTDDIPLLLEHFLKSGNGQRGGKPKEFSARAISMLQEYDWPGNVRELKNFVERVVILSEDETITPADVAMSIPSLNDYQLLWEEIESPRASAPDPESLHSLVQLEGKYIRYIMKISENNMARASQILEISPETLGDKLKRYALMSEEYSGVIVASKFDNR